MELNEKKVELTFTDIWEDYKMFRRSYYFMQLKTARQQMDENMVEVDTKNFSMLEYLRDC